VTISLTLERGTIVKYQKMASLQKEENGWATAGLFMWKDQLKNVVRTSSGLES